MADLNSNPPPQSCGKSCQSATSIEELNRTCYCLSLDDAALRRGLEAELGARGLSRAMVETHPHLFASVPMFVSREHVERMARVIGAVEAVVATPHFRRAALAWAPEISRYDPGSPGGLLGYDFHLTVEAPQLIEINTNPGGALLNAVLGRAHRSCCADAAGLAMAPMEADAIEEALVEVFMTEWRLQLKHTALMSVAIVDEAPEQQYLYPEFLMYKQLLSRHGIEVTICDPRELVRKDARLWSGSQPIDFVYNRLTDFALEQPAQAALKLAYLAREVVVSPHPRAHALYADKRNLTLLCDEAFLRDTGITDDAISTLLTAIPRTEIMTAGNRDKLWEKRRELFFKPAAGYGSRNIGSRTTSSAMAAVPRRPVPGSALGPSEARRTLASASLRP